MDLARQLGPGAEEREPVGLALQTASFDEPEEAAYAPGTQKTRVSGEVVRWHVLNGPEAIPAADYIQVATAPPHTTGPALLCWSNLCTWRASRGACCLCLPLLVRNGPCVL